METLKKNRRICKWHKKPIMGKYYKECAKCGYLTIEVKDMETLKKKKLKQYKSCADCYTYELPGLDREGFCTLGFPLTKLKEFITRTARHGQDTIFFDHKPKYGCVQKGYYGAPKFDSEEARRIAQLLDVNL